MALIVGNWKMHLNVVESSLYLERLVPKLLDSKHQIVLCPSFPAAYTVADAVRKRGWDERVRVGVQNLNDHDEGAFTGEVSPTQIKDFVHYAIIGHSERRMHFGETDELIAHKLVAALRHDIAPILCVGETEMEREAGQSAMRVIDQLQTNLAHLSAKDAADIVIAYEPIWAIGTGKNATPEEAQKMFIIIKKALSDRYGAKVVANIPFLYGGSVDEGNAKSFLASGLCKGLLVGGASIVLDKFVSIAHA